MNDDFLYQLRRPPPPALARRLKAKLDRTSRGPWRTLRIGLLLFLFGAAFALVSPEVRHSLLAYLHSQQPPGATQEIQIPPPPAQSSHSVRAAASNATTTEDANTSKRLRLPKATESGQASGLAVAVAHDNVAHEVNSAPLTSLPTTAAIVYVPSPEEAGDRAVKIRQGLFKVMGWEMAPLADMLRGKRPFDAATAEQQARRISQMSALIVDVFRIDTRRMSVPTHARADIWTNWPDFTAKANDLTRAADSAAITTHEDDGAAALRVIAAVGTACAACHNAYRTRPGSE